MQKIIVRCTFEIPVEVPDESEVPGYDECFDIEDNHCPGTGIVGAAFDKIYEETTKEGFCWACKLKGKCEIL